MGSHHVAEPLFFSKPPKAGTHFFFVQFLATVIVGVLVGLKPSSVPDSKISVMLQKKRAGSFVEETVALVPWADMLNHSSAAGRESCLVYDQRSGMATLQAHCAYSEGQQVFDSYGPNCSPSRLLLDYGFVDDENANHAVDLPVRKCFFISRCEDFVMLAFHI
jgi:hypothetical protein